MELIPEPTSSKPPSDFFAGPSQPVNESRTPSQAVQAVQDIGFGSIAGIVGKAIEYPFDTVKVRLQSQPEGRPALYTGPIDCFKQSIAKDGLRSLYRGVSAPLAGAAVENSCLFFSYRLAQEALRVIAYRDVATADPLPLGGLCLAGAASGAFTSLVLTPVELVKCKMQVPISSDTPTSASVKAPTTLAVISSIFKHRGFSGFWNGQLGTLIRETGGSAAWFGGYEGVGLMFKKRRRAAGRKEDISVPEQLVAGACAGMAYNITFYPADTIKSRMQTEDVTKLPGIGKDRQTFWTVGKALWRDQGLKGMYRGCGITVARSAPSSAFVFTIFEGLKAHFA